MINNKKRSNTFQVDSFSKSKDSQKNIKKDQKEKLNKKFGDFKDDFNVQPERSFLKIGEKSSNDNIQKTKLEFQKIWERPKALPFSEIGPEFGIQ